jgi:predicted GNAT superfamily acetyltransferase
MRVFITYLLLVFSFHAAAQNFIGMQKDEIIKVMQKDRPHFKLDKNSINRTYNYIKFVDKISEQTLLFFLSESNSCTYVRWMSDYANLNEIITELDKKYKKKDEKTWNYTDKGQDYIVKLEEGEWFFTVSIRKK